MKVIIKTLEEMPKHTRGKPGAGMYLYYMGLYGFIWDYLFYIYIYCLYIIIYIYIYDYLWFMWFILYMVQNNRTLLV